MARWHLSLKQLGAFKLKLTNKKSPRALLSVHQFIVVVTAVSNLGLLICSSFSISALGQATERLGWGIRPSQCLYQQLCRFFLGQQYFESWPISAAVLLVSHLKISINYLPSKCVAQLLPRLLSQSHLTSVIRTTNKKLECSVQKWCRSTRIKMYTHTFSKRNI